MHPFFLYLRQTVIRLFTGKYLMIQVVAILATYVLVVSGFDYIYYLATDTPLLRTLFFLAVIVGGIIPIVLPLWFLAYGKLFNHKKVTLLAWMLAQAAALGYLFSSFYKAFTGRVPPSHTVNSIIDISREFRFGFWEGGIFWGWPSSHTTIAFAMATVIWYMYPKHIWAKYLAMVCALYIALGVSMSIHWLSEAVAGVLFGVIIGASLSRSFKQRWTDTHHSSR